MLLIVVLTVVAMPRVSAQGAYEIIQSHIDAVGGSDNWAKIKSMKMTGTLSVMGMDVSMTQTVVNEKGMRMDISALGMSGYTIITPKEGWIYMPFQPGLDKVTPIPAEELKTSQDKINIKAVQLVDKSKIVKADYLGRDTVNNISCYKVKVTDNDSNVQTAFFDAATYYLVRTESKVKVQGEDQEVGVNFSHFQKLPEGVTIAMVWGSPQGDVTFSSIELNKPYDENIFKPETAVKK